MLGSVFSLETLSSVDGPGIRTVVFLAGCHKRCLYCHNPEMFQMTKPTISSSLLASKLIRYKNYFKRGGGITFSGGEPLLQTNFLIEVCKKLKQENISIALDTAGDYIGDLETLLSLVDLVILDIKDVRKEEYFYLTKVSIQKVEEFIHILNKFNLKVSLRQVIIPGFNDTMEYMILLKKYIQKIKNVTDITFIPYHKLGEEKYHDLNLENKMKDIPPMDKEKCEKLYQAFLKLEV